MDKYCRSCKARHPEPINKDCPTRLAKAKKQPAMGQQDAAKIITDMQGTMLQFMEKVNQNRDQMREEMARRRSGASSIPCHASPGDGSPGSTRSTRSRRSKSYSPGRKSPKRTPKKDDHSLPRPFSQDLQTAKKVRQGQNCVI